MKDPSTGKVRVLQQGSGGEGAAVFGKCGTGHLGSVSPARFVRASDPTNLLLAGPASGLVGAP